MKRSILLFIIILICFILPFSSCKKEDANSDFSEAINTANTTDEESSIDNQSSTVSENESVISTDEESHDESGIGEGGDETINRYIENAMNLAPISLIIGYDKWVDYIDNKIEAVKFEKRPNDDPPHLYKMIQYFDISKEDFVAMVESQRKNPTMTCDYTDETIELLFCGDAAKMKKELTHELAWYDNGNVYSFRELQQMSKDELDEIFETQEELDRYTAKAKLYLENYDPNLIEKLDDMTSTYKG
jgi:hypothetical protein